MKELTKGFNDNTKRVIAIGNFDGFHKGHQLLFLKLQGFKECIKTILTFENLNKDYHHTNAILTSLKDKEDMLQRYGIDEMLYIDFNQEFKNLTPEEFFDDYLSGLNIEAIIVGKDFRFGKNLMGNIETIKSLTNKTVVAVDLLQDNSSFKKISTTEIIDCIKSSDLKRAKNYLGRDYSIKGKITHGYQNGHRLGFPTANINIVDDYVLPGNGVYATRIKIKDKNYLSMTNIGTHPTLDELLEKSIETNIFDFNEDIYNEAVELTFLEFIRKEKKFDSKEELRKQLAQDMKYIKNSYL